MADEEAPTPRIPSRAERNAATSQRDHGGGPPKEVEPKQGRPNDLGEFAAPYALPNSTLAERAKARETRGVKQVDAADEVEDKAVAKSQSRRK